VAKYLSLNTLTYRCFNGDLLYRLCGKKLSFKHYLNEHQILFTINLKSLPEVLYRCETWSLTLREEHRRRVFENMVLRRIFGPKRDEVTGEWRKLHNEELHDLYNILRQVLLE
jgi:hypothetical protein